MNPAAVVFATPQQPAPLGFLDDLGVRPGARVEVLEKHPFDGPLVLRVDGRDCTLGERIARHIYVRKLHGDASSAVTIPSGTAAAGRAKEGTG